MGRRDNGEGSFNEMKSGSLRYRKTAKIEGTVYKLQVTGRTKAECKAKMKALEDSKKMNITVAGNTITLAELCKKHLQYQIQQKIKVRPKTIDRDECTIRNQIEKYDIGTFQAQSICPYEISEHIDILLMQNSHSTAIKAYNIINSTYRWAILHKILFENPCATVHDSIVAKMKKKEAKKRYYGQVSVLSKREVEILKKEALKTDDEGNYLYNGLGLMTIFTLEVGIRGGETCALRWKDYHSDTKSMDISRSRSVAKNRPDGGSHYLPFDDVLKNYKRRELLLSDEAVDMIEKAKRTRGKVMPDDYIFINSNGNPYNSSTFSKRINTIYSNCGFSDSYITGTHILRRTFATNKYEEGADVESIAAYIGDSVQTVNEKYINHCNNVLVEGRVKNLVPLPNNKRK